MADDVIFAKEDRVKVSSGKLKGNKGYVRYVGAVSNKSDVIYVGVELDEPNGKHDGRAKGKRYFKCRDRHGYMAPHDTFELFGKSKKKLSNRRLTRLPKAKPSKSARRPSSSTSSSLSASPSLSMKNAKSSKLPRDKKDRIKKKKKAAPDVVMDDIMNMNSNNLAPSKSPTPIVTQITYRDQEVQTEMALSLVNDDNDIATVSKEVAQAHQNMIQSLRGQITKLNAQIVNIKSKDLKLENEMLSKNDLIEMMSITKEAMTEEIEALYNKLEENEIVIGNLQLDIEDMKDERVKLRHKFIAELESGAQDVSEVLVQNQSLKETLDVFRQTAIKQLEKKNNEILNLSLKCRTIPSLQKHIKTLEEDLTTKQNVENELTEFKREIDLRSDSDKIIEILSTKNVELEYEIKRLKEVNKHLEKMQNIHHEIEQENEQYVFDLNEVIKNRDTEHDDMKRKLDKLEKELRHSQNTVFQFKDHIRKLEDTKRKMMVTTDNAVLNKKEQRLQKEMLLRTNLELLNKIENNKNELINYTQIAAKGFSHSLENIILKQHVPNNINVDYGAMQCLSFLQRISFKVRFCKEVLDLFYISDQNTMGGDIASNVAADYNSNDIRDMYKVLEICPILVKQDRFIEAIQRALTASYVDKFNEAVSHYAILLDVEEKYDSLLAAVKEDDIRSRINISDIFRCNDLFRSFIKRYFDDFQFEQKLRANEKVDKWSLYETLQQLKYNLYVMQFKMREINDVIAKCSGNNTHYEEEEEYDEDEDDDLIMRNGSRNKHRQQRQLLFGVLQKMEELQSHLTDIVRRSLQYCAPSRCMLVGVHNNLNKLQDENYIGIEFDFVESTAHMMRKLVTKQNILFEGVNNIHTDDISVSDFDRIGKINRLLDEESESSFDGLVPCLEKLYKHLKQLPYGLEQLYKNSVADPSSRDYKTEKELSAIALGQMQTDKLYIMHMELERELIKEKKRKEKSLIRSTDSDNREEESVSIQMPPWIEKAKLIKAELEKADIIRDALESAQAEIKYKHKELLLEKSNTQQVRSRLDVVKLELAKQHTINRDLVHFELEAKESESKLMTYMDYNKKVKSERDKLMKKNNELESKLTSYQNTLKSMKLASNRKKIKKVHHDDEDEPHQHHGHREHTRHPSLRRTSSVNLRKHRRGSSLNLGKNTPLSLGDPANSFDASIDRDASDDRRVIHQLHKQLQMNKNYNKLLEKTINSLRHNHHIYDLSRQWIEIKRDLRTLPSFHSINASQLKLYKHKKHHLLNQKKLSDARKKKQRKKLLHSKEREDASLMETEDENDLPLEKQVEEGANDALLSSFKQKEIKKRRYETVQKSLRDLDLEFGAIYSKPNMVDLQKEKDDMYSQDLIGRNLKLRDLKLKCFKLSKECKEIESNFSNENQLENDVNMNEKNRSNLSILGRIDIEGLQNTQYQIQQTNVCLNRSNVTKLHNYLNVIC